mgnify:CR=1 FL=1
MSMAMISVVLAKRSNLAGGLEAAAAQTESPPAASKHKRPSRRKRNNSNRKAKAPALAADVPAKAEKLVKRLAAAGASTDSATTCGATLVCPSRFFCAAPPHCTKAQQARWFIVDGSHMLFLMEHSVYA